MHARCILAAALPAVLISMAVVTPAHAGSTEYVDLSLFDSTPERTTAVLHLDGPTSGELGGAMDLSIEATDGSLPTDFGACEEVGVKAVVTVREGVVLTVRTTGEACAHQVDGSLQVNASFDRHDVWGRGGTVRRARLVGDGLIAASQGWQGAQASFSGTFRW